MRGDSVNAKSVKPYPSILAVAATPAAAAQFVRNIHMVGARSEIRARQDARGSDSFFDRLSDRLRLAGASIHADMAASTILTANGSFGDLIAAHNMTMASAIFTFFESPKHGTVRPLFSGYRASQA